MTNNANTPPLALVKSGELVDDYVRDMLVTLIVIDQAARSGLIFLPQALAALLEAQITTAQSELRQRGAAS